MNLYVEIYIVSYSTKNLTKFIKIVNNSKTIKYEYIRAPFSA